MVLIAPEIIDIYALYGRGRDAVIDVEDFECFVIDLIVNGQRLQPGFGFLVLGFHESQCLRVIHGF